MKLISGILIIASFWRLALKVSGAEASEIAVAKVPSTEKIINGSDAREYEFPFQLRLLKPHPSSKDFRQFCGATIISEHYALTAAHCLTVEVSGKFVSISPEALRISAGTIYNNPLTEPTKHSYERKVQHFKIHPNYNQSCSRKHDIAILKVREPFVVKQPLSEVIKLDLNPGTGVVDGTAMILGWGDIGIEESNRTEPYQLQKAFVTLRPHEYCESVYMEGVHKYDRNTMLCTGGGFYAFSSGCQGDSGGPLIYSKKQIGIVSFGDEHCRLYMPAAYTNVSAYAEWIRKNTNVDY